MEQPKQNESQMLVSDWMREVLFRTAFSGTAEGFGEAACAGPVLQQSAFQGCLEFVDC